MKVTKSLVKWFEQEQKDCGTETALSNVLWQVANDLLRDLGIVGVHTVYKKEKKNENKKSK